MSLSCSTWHRPRSVSSRANRIDDGVEVRAGQTARPSCQDDSCPVSPSISARATMPCLNSSGNEASEPSSTPSARRPFQVNATDTHRLSFSIEARSLPGRMHRLKDGGQPGPSAGSVPKRQKFVSSGDRWRAGHRICTGYRQTRACSRPPDWITASGRACWRTPPST